MPCMVDESQFVSVNSHRGIHGSSSIANFQIFIIEQALMEDFFFDEIFNSHFKCPKSYKIQMLALSSYVISFRFFISYR